MPKIVSRQKSKSYFYRTLPNFESDFEITFLIIFTRRMVGDFIYFLYVIFCVLYGRKSI